MMGGACKNRVCVMRHILEISSPTSRASRGEWLLRMRLALTAAIVAASPYYLAAQETALQFAKEAERRGEQDKTVAIPRQVVSRFIAKEYDYEPGLDYEDDKGPFHQTRFRYRLHVPELLKPGERYPLIVWIHGCGEERGWDNLSQLQYLDKTLFAGQPLQFYVLAPQAPLIPGVPGVWHYRTADPETRSVIGQEDEMLTVVMRILDKTIKEEAIDPDRVTLVGISCAANACLELGIRYPERWAALAPLSLGGIDPRRLSGLPKCPIWAFNNKFDEYQTPASLAALDRSIAGARKLGANFGYTLVGSQEYKHDSWTMAFQQHDLLEWLLLQDRGDLGWAYPPGVKPADWPWKQPLREWSALAIWAQTAVVITIPMTGLYLWGRRETLAKIFRKPADEDPLKARR
jgi:predicted esterase